MKANLLPFLYQTCKPQSLLNLKKSGVPARFLSVDASQYEPFAIFFASFSIEANKVGTSIKKLTSLILCDNLEILIVSRKK